MKVFVLICESIYDMCNETISCAVFDSMEGAKEKMREEWENSRCEWDGEDYEHDIGETWAYHQQEGRFSETHCQWQIEEREVNAAD